MKILTESLSLVIPVFNERENIIPLVEAIQQALSGVDYEAVFIDDDSKDGTADTIRGLAGRFPVRVVVRRDKRGLASAVVDGIGFAGGNIVGVMDADLQHPPGVLPALYQAIQKGAEVAVASRYVKGGGCEGWGLVRRVISKGAVFIAHLFLPQTRNVHDPMSGFFMFRKTVVEGVALTPTGYKILLEILVKGRYRQLVEVPYQFRTRAKGESKLGVKTQLDYLRHVYSLMDRRRELGRFLKFCLVGGSGVLVNVGLLWVLTEYAGLFYLFSSAIAIETSVLSNYIFNDFLTFRDRHSRGQKDFFKRMLKFNAVSLVGVGLNLAILWLLTSFAGLHYIISNLFGIAAATFWNYLANVLWTWR
ncbi:MAG: glycosyltransferase family 2 protein [Dehalococcoidia bacterium]|nr:glycosyltransferase family 2 protein [Dehalococcoidia bacterium]